MKIYIFQRMWFPKLEDIGSKGQMPFQHGQTKWVIWKTWSHRLFYKHDINNN